jgi:hypothetical protein
MPSPDKEGDKERRIRSAVQCSEMGGAGIVHLRDDQSR